jgi:uncharacterized MAPEG superfamily protein
MNTRRNIRVLEVTQTHIHIHAHTFTPVCGRAFGATSQSDEGTQAFAAAALVDLVAVGIPCNYGDDAQHLVRSLSSLQAH